MRGKSDDYIQRQHSISSPLIPRICDIYPHLLRLPWSLALWFARPHVLSLCQLHLQVLARSSDDLGGLYVLFVRPFLASLS
jgi:hypothetical protein